MTAQEAYEAIRRAGYRHGITVRTHDQFEPDCSRISGAIIITADGVFDGVDIADACAKVIASLPRALRPLAILRREWDYADEEGRLQRERDRMWLDLANALVK